MRFPIRPIYIILALALVLRLWGITYALPQFFVNDERAGVYGALKMLELGTLVPARHEAEFRQVLNYLPLPSYLYLIVLTPVLGLGYLLSGAAGLAQYRAALTLDPTVIFLASRALIALMGTAVVWLTYRLGWGIFASERTGLLAAAFLAVSFYHLQLSHVTRQWMPAALALALAWLAALAIYRGGGTKGYAWGGLLAGLGFGANPAAAVAMAPMVLAHFLRPSGEAFSRRISDRRWLFCVALFLAVSLASVALYPYGLSQGEVVGGGIRATLSAKLAGFAGKSLAGWLAFLWFYVKLLFTYETILFAAALGGALLMACRHRRWLAVAGVFAAGYLTLLYLAFNIIERGILFLLPVLSVAAGYAADRLWQKLGNLEIEKLRIRSTFSHFLISSFFALFLFGWPLAVGLRYDYLLTQEDTRILAADWIYAETPPEAKILADLPYLRLTNTKAGIRELGGIDPAGLRIQDRVLLGLTEQRYPQPNREVLNLHFISPLHPHRQAGDAAFFTSRGYRFFAVEYEYQDRRDLTPQSRAFMDQGRLLQRFAPSAAGAAGRALDVSGEIATVPPWGLWAVRRFGFFVDVYAL